MLKTKNTFTGVSVRENEKYFYQSFSPGKIKNIFTGVSVRENEKYFYQSISPVKYKINLFVYKKMNSFFYRE